MTVSWAVGRINMETRRAPAAHSTSSSVPALNQTPLKPSGTVNVYALLCGNGSATRHATAAAQAQRTDARSTIRTVTKHRVRQVKAEATVGSDAELAPRHLRCGHRRSAEQHRTDRRGHPAEQRADQSGLPTPTRRLTACAP
jgi:hypothetical protein